MNLSHTQVCGIFGLEFVIFFALDLRFDRCPLVLGGGFCAL